MRRIFARPVLAVGLAVVLAVALAAYLIVLGHAHVEMWPIRPALG